MHNKLIFLQEEKMQPWGSPKILPPGAYDYILFGNPEKNELYTFRFKLPENYQISPFTLTALCCMTVISGYLYIGQSNKFEKRNCQLLSQNGFVVIPADIPLYFWTNAKVTLQFHGMGPVNFVYID